MTDDNKDEKIKELEQKLEEANKLIEEIKFCWAKLQMNRLRNLLDELTGET